MKGVLPAAEISELDERVKVLESYPLQVPGEEAERHLVKMQRIS